MPHIEVVAIGCALFSILAFVLWNASRGGNKADEIEKAMNSGLFSVQTSQWEQAEVQLEYALSLMDGQERIDAAKLVSCMLALAQCYERVGKHKECEQMYPRVIASWERQLSKRGASLVDIDFAATNNDFGRGTFDVAEFYINKLIPMRESSLPPGHSDLTNSYQIAARLLRKLGRKEEAEQYELKAAAK